MEAIQAIEAKEVALKEIKRLQASLKKVKTTIAKDLQSHLKYSNKFFEEPDSIHILKDYKATILKLTNLYDYLITLEQDTIENCNKSINFN